MTWVSNLIGTSEAGKKGSGKISLSNFTSTFEEGTKKQSAGPFCIGFPKGERTKTLEKCSGSGKDVFCSLEISSDKDSYKPLICWSIPYNVRFVFDNSRCFRRSSQRERKRKENFQVEKRDLFIGVTRRVGW